MMVDIHRDALVNWSPDKCQRKPMPRELIYRSVIDKLRSTGYSDLVEIIEADSHVPNLDLGFSLFTRQFWISSRYVVIDISAFEECKQLRRDSMLTNRALLKAFRHLYQILVDLSVFEPHRKPYYKWSDHDYDVQRALMYDEDIDERVLANHYTGVFESLIEGFVPIIVEDSVSAYSCQIDMYRKLWPNLVTITACQLRKQYDKNPESVIAKLDVTIIIVPRGTQPYNIQFITKLFDNHRDFTPHLIEGANPTSHRRRTKWWIDLRQLVATKAIECTGRPTLIDAYLERKRAKATIWKYWMRARNDPRMCVCRKRFVDDMQTIEQDMYTKNKRHRHSV
jgi:hypothetical protein